MADIIFFNGKPFLHTFMIYPAFMVGLTFKVNIRGVWSWKQICLPTLFDTT